MSALGPPSGRRQFLVRSLAGAASLSFGALARRAGAAVASPGSGGYGPLAPVADETTGLPLLRLPAGFRYLSYGWTGQRMDDGQETPRLHDGMAVVGRKGRKLVLVRNHEQDVFPEAGAGELVEPIRFKGRAAYDPDFGAGGTTQLVFDLVAGRFESSWASLSGTCRNCAGGPTPWGSWLTSEESLSVSPAGVRHGFIFEVPAEGRPSGKPLVDMGRALWEASATDPATGDVYQTEDAVPGGFYRFAPKRQGQLRDGGALAALKVKGEPDFNFSGRNGVWLDHPAGTRWPVEWVRVEDPQAQGGRIYDSAPGRACFARPEGCWFDAGRVYFSCTSGGLARSGQVFAFDPRLQTLEVLFNASGRGASPSECNQPDNIAVSPRGGIVLCEDGDSSASQKLRGLTQAGETFVFADNDVVLEAADVARLDRALRARGGVERRIAPRSYVDREWAGACFHERWLFVNIQTPGVTFAITGPWETGAL